MSGRRSRQWAVTMVASALVLAACGGASNDDATDATADDGNPSDGPAASVPIDSPETTDGPVDIGPVTVDRDEAASTTMTIGSDGGTITAVDAAGTTYELVVPAGSLAGDTEIVATPASLDGVPFPSHTVMFGPTGLQFIEPATLTITTTQAIPTEEQFFYQLNDEATEFVAAIPDSIDTTMAMQVRHFSGYGAASASGAARAALLGKQATDAAAVIESKLVERLNEIRAQYDRDGTLVSTEEAFGEFRTAYVEQVIAPRLEAASSSCEAASSAVQTVLGFDRTELLFGYDGAQRDLVALVDRIYGEGSPCEKEAIAKCKAAKDPAPLLRFWLEGLRMRALLGRESAASVADLQKRATKICKPVTYTASGSEGEATFSGTVASYTAPFNIDVKFVGGNGFYVMTPNPDGLSGSIIIEAGGSGVSVSGGGSYTAVENEDGTVTISTSTNSCVEQLGSCRNGAVVITLTPNEPES